MHEYEFRWVVEDSSPFLPLLQSLGRPVRQETVYYAKPHFRFRNDRFEKKRVRSVRAVYHDGYWFRWVHSVEIPFRSWSQSTYLTFLHVFNYQDPFEVETRHVVEIDSRVKLYAFRTRARTHRLVFEWEYGAFSKPLTRLNPALLFESLTRYRNLYGLLERYSAPAGYVLNENLSRRSVACVEEIVSDETRSHLYAHKLDGVFGLVYSYRDKIKEKWEGYECVVRQNETLGDGLVFAAERLADGRVYLLDVYQVRGHETAKWCRRQILTQFLVGLKDLPEGYRVQRYFSSKESLETTKPCAETDGVVLHDVVKDVVFKYKTSHSLDLVYSRGYFHLPNGRIKCSVGKEGEGKDEEVLEEGCVYEISTADGRILRKRTDRFKGNSASQIADVLKHGWHGPPIEPLPPSTERAAVSSRKKTVKRKR